MYAVSTSSLTGVSSGSVTSMTWQRAGSVSSSSTSRAWVLIGPTRDRVEQARGRLQERDGVAGGGRVEHDQVGRAGPLELLDLAEHEDVLDAGRGGGDDVERAARCTSRLRDPAHAVVLEVLEQRVVGRERPGPHVGRAAGPPPGASTTSS